MWNILELLSKGFTKKSIYGLVSASLTNKIGRKKAAQLSKRSMKSISYFRGQLKRNISSEYILSDVPHYKRCEKVLNQWIMEYVKTISGY